MGIGSPSTGANTLLQRRSKIAAMSWAPQPDLKRSFRLQPLVTVLSVGTATAPAISLGDRVAPLALAPRTPARGTVTPLCAATADWPRGCHAHSGRCAPGGAGSVTYPERTEAHMIDGANQPSRQLVAIPRPERN